MRTGRLMVALTILVGCVAKDGSGEGGDRSTAAGGMDARAAENAPPVTAAGGLMVVGPRIARPPAGDQAVLYLTVRNEGPDADTLVAIRSAFAASASLHESIVRNGVARMAPAGTPVLEPGGRLELRPGGLHGMLGGLVQPLEVGDTVQVTLVFARAGDVTLSVPVVSYADLEAGTDAHQERGGGS